MPHYHIYVAGVSHSFTVEAEEPPAFREGNEPITFHRTEGGPLVVRASALVAFTEVVPKGSRLD